MTHEQLCEQLELLKKDNENLRAYAKHERDLGAEPFAIENQELHQQIERLKTALRLIQWGDTIAVPKRDGSGEMEIVHLCPRCDQPESAGHAPDCEVGMALEP